MKPDAESYYRRGHAYYWIYDNEKAIQDYDMAIELDAKPGRGTQISQRN